jgi:hypothetical protein
MRSARGAETGATRSARKICNQSVAAAVLAPLRITTTPTTATSGFLIALRHLLCPGTLFGLRSSRDSRSQAASTSVVTSKSSAFCAATASSFMVTNVDRQAGQFVMCWRSESATPSGSSRSRRSVPSAG